MKNEGKRAGADIECGAKNGLTERSEWGNGSKTWFGGGSTLLEKLLHSLLYGVLSRKEGEGRKKRGGRIDNKKGREKKRERDTTGVERGSEEISWRKGETEHVNKPVERKLIKVHSALRGMKEVERRK